MRKTPNFLFLIVFWNIDQKHNLVCHSSLFVSFGWLVCFIQNECNVFLVHTGGVSVDLPRISEKVYFCNWEWLHMQTNTVLRGDLRVQDICWATATHKHWLVNRILSHTNGNRQSRKWKTWLTKYLEPNSYFPLNSAMYFLQGIFGHDEMSLFKKCTIVMVILHNESLDSSPCKNCSFCNKFWKDLIWQRRLTQRDPSRHLYTSEK